MIPLTLTYGKTKINNVNKNEISNTNVRNNEYSCRNQIKIEIEHSNDSINITRENVNTQHYYINSQHNHNEENNKINNSNKSRHIM